MIYPALPPSGRTGAMLATSCRGRLGRRSAAGEGRHTVVTRPGGPGRSAAAAAAVAAATLHTVSAFWVWRSWGYFGRANVLVWMDFPVSLLFLDWSESRFLAASLLLGGLQWAVIGALLAALLGRSLRRKSA